MGNLPMVVIGADPELFVYDTSKNSLTSAIPFFPAGKGNGEIVTSEAGARVLHDNVAVEFNCRPYGTAQDFSKGMENILAGLQRMLLERANSSFVLVHDVGSAVFPQRLLRHREARRFGCEYDLDAWTSFRNPTRTAQEVGNLRVIGGHLHIGMRGSDTRVDSLLREQSSCCAIVKLLDATLGQYIALLESESKHTSTFVERRKFYGAAGAFRKKPYGLEYRTPSPIWLQNKGTMEMVFNIVNGVLREVADDRDSKGYEISEVTKNGNRLPLYCELIGDADLSDNDVIESVNTSSPKKELLNYALSV